MKTKIFRRKSSFSCPSREIVSIVGTVVLMFFLIGIEIFLGREQNCGETFWLICQIEESVFMDKAETFGFLFAIILFLLESPDRQKQAIYEAWKTIDAAKGVETSGARNAALRTINSFGESLRGLDAVGADLNNIELEGSTLTGANLRGALLREANLENSNLVAANLQETILKGANLRRGNLKRANLEGANLEGADLEGANLAGANLRNANLEGANVRDIKFDQAILTDVKGLSLRQYHPSNNSLKGVKGRRRKDSTPSESNNNSCTKPWKKFSLKGIQWFKQILW